MKITQFTIDPLGKKVSIIAQEPGGILVNVMQIPLVGHEGKTVAELEHHAREEARKALHELAAAL